MTKVLVYIDDSPDDLFLFQSACRLAKVRFQPVFIEGGVEAILYLDRAGKYSDRDLFPEPDLVLLDLKMPDVDGFAVLKHLRGDPLREHCPVGLLTSSNWPADIEQARKDGANWYFTKPPDMLHLIEFVKIVDDCLWSFAACAEMDERLSAFSH